MEQDLYGLILVGGRSRRMGEDKASIQFHDEPHAQYLFNLVKSKVESVFCAVRQEQTISFTDQIITDTFDVKGPMNGLLSAHEAFPTKAWLVFAVDLPFVTENTIKRLIDERDKNMFVTCLVHEKDSLPEPLSAIWEPQALAKLKEHHEKNQEIYPRRFLINSPIKEIHVANQHELFNVNNQQDLALARAMIQKKNI